MLSNIKKIKVTGSRPGVSYCLCKVYFILLDSFFYLLERRQIKFRNFWFPELILLHLMNSSSKTLFGFQKK